MKRETPTKLPGLKAYVADIGRILVNEHGKKKYYQPEEVKAASRKSKLIDWRGVGIDVADWAMSIFVSHLDFDAYQESQGQTYDFATMKTELLSSLSDQKSLDWSVVTESDLDASWLDFGEVFGSLLDGIGDFIGGIFDGLS